VVTVGTSPLLLSIVLSSRFLLACVSQPCVLAASGGYHYKYLEKRIARQMQWNIRKYSRLDSVVGIATYYGLDGPGTESMCGARVSMPIQSGLYAHSASCTLDLTQG